MKPPVLTSRTRALVLRRNLTVTILRGCQNNDNTNHSAAYS